MPNENEDHIILKEAERSAFIELAFDGHGYTGYFYSNARANGSVLSTAALRQFLRTTVYATGRHTLSAAEFNDVLRRLGMTPRRQPNKRRKK